jgi:hypothetical protein
VRRGRRREYDLAQRLGDVVEVVAREGGRGVVTQGEDAREGARHRAGRAVDAVDGHAFLHPVVGHDDLDGALLREVRDLAVDVSERRGSVEEGADEAALRIQPLLFLDAEEAVARIAGAGRGGSVDVEPAAARARRGRRPHGPAVRRDGLPAGDPHRAPEHRRIRWVDRDDRGERVGRAECHGLGVRVLAARHPDHGPLPGLAALPHEREAVCEIVRGVPVGTIGER